MEFWTAVVVVIVAIVSVQRALERWAHRLPIGARIALGDLDVDDPWSEEEIRAAFARDRITEAEMERRLDVAVDDRVPRIRRTVESVGKIGEERSRAIVQAGYRSEWALQQATEEDFKEIPDIGEELAAALVEEVSR